MATMANDNLLYNYRNFFEQFASSIAVGPQDPLPVKVANYKLNKNELVGAIVDWSLQYLNQKQCPRTLVSTLVSLTVKAMQQLCKMDPDTCGFHKDLEAYEPIHLMKAVMIKVNEICLRYLDNISELSNLQTLHNPMVAPITASYAVKNTRRQMEDRLICIDDLNTVFDVQDSDGPSSYYGVFDGHGGSEAAAYSAAHLHQYLAQSLYYHTNPERALREAFVLTDAAFVDKAQKSNLNSGTTALCALLRPKQNKLYVAWVGDSLALLANQGQIVQLVQPHRPCRKDERERIENMGGHVSLWGQNWRVDGQLAITRAIGDTKFKPYVTGDPNMITIPLTGGEDFLVLATDGLWDCVDDDKVAQYVYCQIIYHQNTSDIINIPVNLVKKAKEAGSSDNISVIVVFLRDPHQIATSKSIRESINLPDSPNHNGGSGVNNTCTTPKSDNNMDLELEPALDNSNKNPFTVGLNNSNEKDHDQQQILDEITTDNKTEIYNKQNGTNNLIPNNDTNNEFYDNMHEDLAGAVLNGKNGKDDSEYDEEDESDDYGPETDVDNVDCHNNLNAMSPTLAAAKALSEGIILGSNSISEQDKSPLDSDSDQDDDGYSDENRRPLPESPKEFDNFRTDSPLDESNLKVMSPTLSAAKAMAEGIIPGNNPFSNEMEDRSPLESESDQDDDGYVDENRRVEESVTLDYKELANLNEQCNDEIDFVAHDSKLLEESQNINEQLSKLQVGDEDFVRMEQDILEHQQQSSPTPELDYGISQSETKGKNALEELVKQMEKDFEESQMFSSMDFPFDKIPRSNLLDSQSENLDSTESISPITIESISSYQSGKAEFDTEEKLEDISHTSVPSLISDRSGRVYRVTTLEPCDYDLREPWLDNPSKTSQRSESFKIPRGPITIIHTFAPKESHQVAKDILKSCINRVLGNSGVVVDNVEESGGEETDDEGWNYIQGDNKQATEAPKEETKEVEDMSQLNPHAAEFVPILPVGPASPLPNLNSDPIDDIVAQSPKRAVINDMIYIEGEINSDEFLNDIKNHPGEVDKLETELSNGAELSKVNFEMPEKVEVELNENGTDDIQNGHTYLNEDTQNISEVLSTAATFGDTTATIDPMSMSFYQEQLEDNIINQSTQLDLNAVHILPDNLEEFIGEESSEPFENSKQQLIDDFTDDKENVEQLSEEYENMQINEKPISKLEEKELESPMSPTRSPFEPELISTEPNNDLVLGQNPFESAEISEPIICESRSPIPEVVVSESPEPVTQSPLPSETIESAQSPLPAETPEPVTESPLPAEILEHDTQSPIPIETPEPVTQSPLPVESPIPPVADETPQQLAQSPIPDIVAETIEPEIIAPVTEEKPIETPVVEAPIIEAPVIETPIVEAPVIEEPHIEAPVVEIPVQETPIEIPSVEPPVIAVPELQIETPIPVVKETPAEAIKEAPKKITAKPRTLPPSKPTTTSRLSSTTKPTAPKVAATRTTTATTKPISKTAPKLTAPISKTSATSLTKTASPKPSTLNGIAKSPRPLAVKTSTTSVTNGLSPKPKPAAPAATKAPLRPKVAPTSVSASTPRSPRPAPLVKKTSASAPSTEKTVKEIVNKQLSSRTTTTTTTNRVPLSARTSKTSTTIGVKKTEPVTSRPTSLANRVSLAATTKTASKTNTTPSLTGIKKTEAKPTLTSRTTTRPGTNPPPRTTVGAKKPATVTSTTKTNTSSSLAASLEQTQTVSLVQEITNVSITNHQLPAESQLTNNLNNIAVE